MPGAWGDSPCVLHSVEIRLARDTSPGLAGLEPNGDMP
jgi:hypothetical protein